MQAINRTKQAVFLLLLILNPYFGFSQFKIGASVGYHKSSGLLAHSVVIADKTEEINAMNGYGFELLVNRMNPNKLQPEFSLGFNEFNYSLNYAYVNTPPPDHFLQESKKYQYLTVATRLFLKLLMKEKLTFSPWAGFTGDYLVKSESYTQFIFQGQPGAGTFDNLSYEERLNFSIELGLGFAFKTPITQIELRPFYKHYLLEQYDSRKIYSYGIRLALLPTFK
jgi:hypothetical protein